MKCKNVLPFVGLHFRTVTQLNLPSYNEPPVWQLTRTRPTRSLPTLLAVALFATGCSGTQKIIDPIAEDHQLPTGTLESVGLVSSYLENASSQIAAKDDHQLHSMLVVRGGVLVFEEYYNGYGRANPHDIRSATKSITSLLTGVAVERGVIANVDTPVMEYLQAEYPQVRDKDDISIRHLLTMGSGLDCDDSD